jgi:predicted alpha/beta superfamily hydrolase
MKPTFTLPSPQTGTEYAIFLKTPPANVPGPYTAVLFMDGDDQFRFAEAAYHALREKEAVAPLVLVGVGYGASYSKPANKRARDYTPAAIPEEKESGGADIFLSFLTETLWPELSRRLPLRDDVRGIGGHSLGSLLVLHALFQPKPFFNRALASAPSLWWADRAILTQVDTLQRTGISLPGKVFLSVGEEDSHSMTGDLTLLEKQLAERPFPQLEVVSKRFAKHDHFNVLPVAFREGFSALFPSGTAGS